MGAAAGSHRGPVHVTAPWTTLAGLDDHPAHLTGYGPITAEQARELAADATWRRILTDPASGTVRDVGRATYTPPAALAEFVRVRDGHCRFPGCRHPAVTRAGRWTWTTPSRSPAGRPRSTTSTPCAGTTT